MKQPVSDDPNATSIITIPLSKQYVPVVRQNRTVMHRTAYFGNIFVGLPTKQKFNVIFDTGSAHLVLPSSNCKSQSCALHNKYNRSMSESAVDIDHDGTPVANASDTRDEVDLEYGTGQLSGAFSREVVCLQGKDEASQAMPNAACTTLRVVFATEMTDEPFMMFKFDGILGLGLEGLSLDSEFNFFGQMTKLNKNMEPRFGFFLSEDDRHASEISFGGPNPQRSSSEIQWVPVLHPHQGYWQLHLPRVLVGGEEVELCKTGGCIAIVDTGTSLLGVPRQLQQDMNWKLARKVSNSPDKLDCRTHPGPDVVFDFESVKVTVGPDAYSRPSSMKLILNKTNTSEVICRASLLPIDASPGLSAKTWILGEPVLRKYYTTFDWVRKQIGFSLALQPGTESGYHNTSHKVIGAPDDTVLTPTVVYA